MFKFASLKSRKFTNQDRISLNSSSKLINCTVILITLLSIQQEAYVVANGGSGSSNSSEPAPDACVRYTGGQNSSCPEMQLGDAAKLAPLSESHLLADDTTKNLTFVTADNAQPNQEPPNLSHLSALAAVLEELYKQQVSQEPEAEDSTIGGGPLPHHQPESYHDNQDPAGYNLDSLGTSESADKGSMVLVAGKAGEFDKILPMGDLFVTQAPEFAQAADESQQDAIESPQQSYHNGIQQVDFVGLPHQQQQQHPSLAELLAASTAMGMRFGDLARKTRSHPDGQEGEEEEVKTEVGGPSSYTDQNHNREESRNMDQSTRDPPLETVMEHEMPERMPESMESLVRSSEQDDLVDPTDENDPSASNLVQDDDDNKSWPDKQSPSSAMKSRRRSGQMLRQRPRQPLRRDRDRDEMDGDDDGDDGAGSGGGRIEESQGEPPENRRYPAAAVTKQNPNEDLKAAAGHYYGKKKMKKKKVKVVVKKKKKKKVVVTKKIKKYKVKKYKVKVIKKKKKKKVKKHVHHHHDHGHDHGKYYMYAKVPKKKSWEFGFKRGNKKHWIERHEKGHKNKFKTKVKWYDKKSKGKGVHIWDYNHFDKKKHHG